MEGFRENDNKLMKNLKYEIFMNETQFEDDVTKESTMSKNDEKKTKHFFIFQRAF